MGLRVSEAGHLVADPLTVCALHFLTLRLLRACWERAALNGFPQGTSHAHSSARLGSSRQHGAAQGGRHQVAVKECIISQEVLVVERVFAMVAPRNVMAINGEVARAAGRGSRRDGRQRSSARSCWLIVEEVLGVVVLIHVMVSNVDVI